MIKMELITRIKQAESQAKEIVEQAKVEAVQIAVQVPDYARNAGVYSPKTKLYVAAGGAFGAAAGAGIVAVLEWLEAGTVRSLRDLDHLGVPVLGSLPSRSSKRRKS